MNSQGFDRLKGNAMKRARAFTLVEILIVVVLLAILALVVILMVSDSVTSARKSAVAHDLNMLRRYVLIYTAQHLEVAPGYPDGDRTQAPTEQAFFEQITLSSNTDGQTAPIGTPGFPRGPYMQFLPVNPLNHKDTVQVLADGDAFPAAGDDSHGWIYKPVTAEMRADCGGSDENGKRYYDY
jgi:prepilin-type N-terminal cleavage/methylation domain-containing protein